MFPCNLTMSQNRAQEYLEDAQSIQQQQSNICKVCHSIKNYQAHEVAEKHDTK